MWKLSNIHSRNNHNLSTAQGNVSCVFYKDNVEALFYLLLLMVCLGSLIEQVSALMNILHFTLFQHKHFDNICNK